MTKKVRMLAISHRKMGMELEHLGKEKESLDSFRKAYQLCEEKFGSEDKWTQRFKHNFEIKLRQANDAFIPIEKRKERPSSASYGNLTHKALIPRKLVRPEWQKTSSPYSKRPYSSKVHDANCHVDNKYAQP